MPPKYVVLDTDPRGIYMCMYKKKIVIKIKDLLKQPLKPNITFYII